MIDWHALAPEIILAALMMLLLLVDLVLPSRSKWTLAGIAAFGLLLSAVPLLTLGASGEARSLFGGSYVVDPFALVLKGFFVLTGYVVLFLSVNMIEEGAFYRGEFYFLLVASIVGMFLVSSARDLVVLLIAFELFSAPGYMLATWNKRSLRSNEAGMKYFLLGVLSTAIMLYGMSLVFGITASTKFTEIAFALARQSGGVAEPMVALSIVLILVGFSFKVSAVPFHFWAPDVYEGAPLPITAFFSVSVKAAGFVGLIMLMYVGFAGNGAIWRPMMWVLSALTMTVGNLIALRQTNIVRFLAYSSIAQSGYILAPFAVVGESPAATANALQAAVIYLLVYGVMNLGAFGVVIAVARRTKSGSLDSYKGLYKSMPVLAVMMTLFMASLTGIPPLAGWLGKFQVFKALAAQGSTWSWVLAGVVAVNSVIAAFYYMSVVRRMFFDEPAPEFAHLEAESTSGLALVPPPIAVALSALSILVIVGGITPVLTYFSEVATLVAR